jgi:hypothetical protein
LEKYIVEVHCRLDLQCQSPINLQNISSIIFIIIVNQYFTIIYSMQIRFQPRKLVGYICFSCVVLYDCDVLVLVDYLVHPQKSMMSVKQTLGDFKVGVNTGV